MKTDRFFYSGAAGVFLVLMMAAFHPFFLHGTHFDGSRIDPSIFSIVAVHGAMDGRGSDGQSICKGRTACLSTSLTIAVDVNMRVNFERG